LKSHFAAAHSRLNLQSRAREFQKRLLHEIEAFLLRFPFRGPTLVLVSIDDQFARFLAKDPQVDPSAYVAPGATLIGDVRLGPKASVWPGSVLRGDINFIEVGEGTNIQDGTIVHLADDYPVKIGKYVTIGHAAMIHACTIEDECLIGMQATILDGAVIGKNSIVGAHSLVTQNTIIPPGSLVLGGPAKVVKTLSPEKQSEIRHWAEKYIEVSAAHRKRFAKKD
jgi:carbonic anhydrase/acetyltransferase-like protein (isoleucine patch superfamily)